MGGQVLLVLLALSLGAVNCQNIPCDMPADILFLLDASSSITSQNWITQKNFVATLINSLHIHPTTMNVGIVVFSTYIVDVVPLSPFKDKQTIVLLTKTLKQAGFGTSTNLGIPKMREIMTTQGHRYDGVPQIAIVITYGQSDYMAETIAQAKAAKDEGIIMIAVGINSHALTSKLENIASSRRKLILVPDFSALSGLVNTLKDLICTATQPPPLTTTPAPNIPRTCLLKEHSDKQKYVQSIPGHGSMVRPCAEGTVFSYPHCSCIKDTDTTVSGRTYAVL